MLTGAANEQIEHPIWQHRLRARRVSESQMRPVFMPGTIPCRPEERWYSLLKSRLPKKTDTLVGTLFGQTGLYQHYNHLRIEPFPMNSKLQWTNASVLKFSAGQSPIAAMEAKARELALKAMDDGWHGPPFDPLALADYLGLRVITRGDIPDARLVPSASGAVTLEYNPMRPRGRLRFSIAHEIAHTLFADHAQEVRNRSGSPDAARDNWQLEVLCNIGAAELLMPLGSFSNLASEELSIRKVMEIRKSFDVSVEACLIRLIKLARLPSAVFCASLHSDGKYRLDYVIPAAGWKCPLAAGQIVPEESAIANANAIGVTAVGTEEWIKGKPLRIECVGLASYTGGTHPRVVGILIDTQDKRYTPPELDEVDGDALSPRGTGNKLIAHVVPDTGAIWGGNGFASQVRRRFPDAWTQFRSETAGASHTPRLGEVYSAKLDASTYIVHMVAQCGIGKSHSPRLRLATLADCLTVVREHATELKASVHLPKIGTGHGGTAWEVVKELVLEELVEEGIKTTVYNKPN